MNPRFERLTLSTPALPCLADGAAFDAFAWCASTTLVWRRPPGPLEVGEPLTSANPTRLAFVMPADAPGSQLPRELAHLHVPGLAAADEWALAPYAIDDATDGLWEWGLEPRGVFELAADRLTALAWGLHDWAHFHNHGPFEARAETELHCDASALVWLLLNAERIGLARSAWERAREELATLSRVRFADEGRSFDEWRLAAGHLEQVACAHRTGA